MCTTHQIRWIYCTALGKICILNFASNFPFNVALLIKSSLVVNHCTVLTFCIVTDIRKRHKKGRDKTWKSEEKRGSGEHRRSGGVHNARRRREWSPDHEGSPTPSLSDGNIISIGLTVGIVKNKC